MSPAYLFQVAVWNSTMSPRCTSTGASASMRSRSSAVMSVCGLNSVMSRQTAVPKNSSSGIFSMVSADGSGSRWEKESTWVGPLSFSMNPVVWNENPLSKRGAVSSCVAWSNCTVLRWPG